MSALECVMRNAIGEDRTPAIALRLLRTSFATPRRRDELFTPSDMMILSVRDFTKPTRTAIASGAADEDIESLLGRAWKNIIDAAADATPESQEQLVADLVALQQESIDGDGIVVWGENKKVWGDMPLFGPSVREAWNRAPATESHDSFLSDQWRNLNAFLARLTALSSHAPVFDFSLYAIWTLRTAFEETGGVRSVDAAKAWFLYAKQVIERLAREEKSFDGKLAQGGDKYKDMGWNGFSSARYEVWRSAIDSA